MKVILVGLVMMSAVSPVTAQDNGLMQLLGGKEISHHMKMKEFGPDWKRISIANINSQSSGMGDMMSQLMPAMMMSEMGKKGVGKPDDAAGAMLGMSLLGGLFGGLTGDAKLPAYYTKGQTVALGGETFLVAYQYKAEKPDFMKMAMESDKPGAKDPDFSKIAESGKMTEESTAELYLINMRSIGSISGIRPFDLKQEIADSQKAGGLMDLMSLGAKDKAAPEKPATAPAKPKSAAPAKKPNK